MTWEEFIKKFNQHCLFCQNSLCSSWCMEFGEDGKNPQLAIEECEKENFERFRPLEECQ